MRLIAERQHRRRVRGGRLSSARRPSPAPLSSSSRVLIVPLVGTTARGRGDELWLILSGRGGTILSG